MTTNTLNPLVASKLEDVILNWMDSGAAFTIYDVVRRTRAVLNQNTDYPTCRLEVERLMRQELNSSTDYVEHHITVDGYACRLWAPNSFTPANYDKDFHAKLPVKVKLPGKVMKKGKTTPMATIQPLVLPATKKTSLKNLRQTDKEGRLTIPVGLLRAFGFKRGSTVYVAARNANQPGLVLLNKKPGSGILQKIKLNASMKVRLAAGVLKRSNLDLSNSLPKVSLTERAIVVSPGV